MNMRKELPVAITIAGSDSGGGAGIQADLKTFAAMGVHGTSAITSVTAQNTYEVRAIHDVPPEIVVAQIEAVAEDLGIDAGKIGMLSNKLIIESAVKAIDKYQFPLVVDPVMIAKSGAKLLRDDAIEALIKQLLPRALVVTPNKPEAEKITGNTINSLKDAREAAQKIVEEYGAESAIVKGGHIKGDYSVDVLYYNGRFYEFKAPRINRDATHGTGCSFSAAIAAGLAKGRDVPKAVQIAKKFITMAIDYGLKIGKGHGPVNPVAWISIPAERYRVLENIEKAVEMLVRNGELVNMVVPEVFINIGMALPKPYAKSPLDVATIPGRIGRYRNTIIVKSKPEFGVSKHIANAILTIMEIDPEMRASANIIYNKEVQEAVEKLGFTQGFFDRREEPLDIKMSEGATTPWGIRRAVERIGGKIPDAVYDYGEHGKEPLTIVFGRDAVDVANKIINIARIISNM